MSNDKSSMWASEVILTRIEVYFHHDGSFHACAFNTWVGNSEGVLQVQTFKRGAHHVKVCCYGRKIGNLPEFGADMARALIDKDETVWKTVHLNEY